ncbi:DUF4845 domain-containing protein [Methylotenera sp. 1P/1]|uniref:DUF4845 domain-containing protein n=1 Tax=Methylotenera sp. 1P/1 TaxID=1131551 RepID=UPI0003698662|nr:DUF4845 domain-containing protein [Methylotenera sp. 1P/1]
MQPFQNGLIRKQRGMSFWGTLVVLAALVFIGTFVMKSLPAYLEFNSVRTAIRFIAKQSSGELNRKEVTEAFDRQATIDNIDSINGRELRIEGGAIVAEYQKVIPLFGNMSILLDFHATTAK